MKIESLSPISLQQSTRYRASDLCYTFSVDAAARREARKQWKGQIFRTWEEAEAFDIQFWLSIPVDERASVVWELSDELHRLTHPNEPDEPRLHRSVAVLTRR